MPGQDVARELDRLLAAFVESHGGDLPRQAFDPGWVSPCQVGAPAEDGTIAWQPQRREPPADWRGLEAALEVPLHPDLATFYGRWFCDNIPVRAEEGTATLIQVWSPRDQERLVENLLGHALQQRRRRLPLTLFVALTDENDFLLSVDNASGTVVLEEPGQPAAREVAPALGALLARMHPDV